MKWIEAGWDWRQVEERHIWVTELLNILSIELLLPLFLRNTLKVNIIIIAILQNEETEKG